MTDSAPTINLSSLLRSLGDTSVSGELTSLRYEQGGEQHTLEFTEPAPYKVEVHTIGGDGEFWLSGRFRPTLQMECARCLRPVSVPLDLELGTLLRYDPATVTPHLEETEEGEEHLVFGLPSLDLSDFLAETTIVEAPLSVLHDPDCKGLCQVCGQDLNEGTCEHAARVPVVEPDQITLEREESPFAALRGLDLPDN
ncbi:DUF177 domain-containing protein [Deinococcus pimensis]|uniref:DUF177 domain-containing protein n=1 Tax=Deinococcus pimensis TaxID=309888 RepID=UPI0004845A68|nr:DUF177 domain-containing protein [Deinococcus pimensis]